MTAWHSLGESIHLKYLEAAQQFSGLPAGCYDQLKPSSKWDGQEVPLPPQERTTGSWSSRDWCQLSSFAPPVPALNSQGDRQEFPCRNSFQQNTGAPGWFLDREEVGVNKIREQFNLLTKELLPCIQLLRSLSLQMLSVFLCK